MGRWCTWFQLLTGSSDLAPRFDDNVDVVDISPYKSDWPHEFEVIGRALRAELGSLASRVDHIGSTSVPGIAAKDIIDVQVSVISLSDELVPLISGLGYEFRPLVTQDHIPELRMSEPGEWR